MQFFAPAARRAFVGEVLFADSIGGTDFPGGNHEELIASIRERLEPRDARELGFVFDERHLVGESHCVAGGEPGEDRRQHDPEEGQLVRNIQFELESLHRVSGEKKSHQRR